MTYGFPSFTTAAQELVVPRSMPTMVRDGLVIGTGWPGRSMATRAGPAESCSTRWGAERSAWATAPGGVSRVILGTDGGAAGEAATAPGTGVAAGTGVATGTGGGTAGIGRAGVSTGGAALAVGGGVGVSVGGARVEGGVIAGRAATGVGPAAPGARPRFSRSETMRSTTAREASSSWVNWTPMPGARGGRAGDSASGSGAWTQRTTPIALITDSPFWRRISRLRTVPTGRGSRVRMKRPPRDMLTAKR